jgi:hypothetical protein
VDGKILLILLFAAIASSYHSLSQGIFEITNYSEIFACPVENDWKCDMLHVFPDEVEVGPALERQDTFITISLMAVDNRRYHLHPCSLSLDNAARTPSAISGSAGRLRLGAGITDFVWAAEDSRISSLGTNKSSSSMIGSTLLA